MRAVSLFTMLFLATSAFAGDHVLDKDKTGMRWVYPFNKARLKAKADKRIPLVKPVAFGTDRQGGW